MVLVYVLSVIMREYTISYTEICNLVKESWHIVCCAS